MIVRHEGQVLYPRIVGDFTASGKAHYYFDSATPRCAMISETLDFDSAATARREQAPMARGEVLMI